MHSDRDLELSPHHRHINSFLPTKCSEVDSHSLFNEVDNTSVLNKSTMTVRFMEKCSFVCGRLNYLLISYIDLILAEVCKWVWKGI